MHVKYGETATSVDYWDHSWDDTTKSVVATQKTCTDFTILTSNPDYTHTVLSDGFYYVDSKIEFRQYLDIDGDVKLILGNDAKMNCKQGTANCPNCMGETEAHTYSKLTEAGKGEYHCKYCFAYMPVTPQALWCKGNNTLYFVAPQEGYAVNGKYDNQTITSVVSGDQVTNSTAQRPSWGITDMTDVHRVVFDESFAMVSPQSLSPQRRHQRQQLDTLHQ